MIGMIGMIRNYALHVWNHSGYNRATLFGIPSPALRFEDGLGTDRCALATGPLPASARDASRHPGPALCDLPSKRAQRGDERGAGYQRFNASHATFAVHHPRRMDQATIAQHNMIE